MLVLFDKSKNPYFNLASEEYLLKVKNFNQPIIRIWQNSPTIIVGKFQNTLAEINKNYVEKNKIAVVRRITGGGAVYHDLGNINYTIIQQTDSKQIDFNQFTKPILQLLATYGLKAENKGRNDIELNGCKISGGAQTILKNRVLHHGTLLFNVKLDTLAKALQTKPAKLAGKGVPSIRTRVGNIVDFMAKPIPVEKFLQDLQAFFMRQQNSALYSYSQQDFAGIQKLREEKYNTWEWNFGQSPDFNLERTKKYFWGELSIMLLLKNNIIEDIKIYGDFFSPSEVQQEFEQLVKTQYCKKALQEKILQTNLCSNLPEMRTEDLLKHLID